MHTFRSHIVRVSSALDFARSLMYFREMSEHFCCFFQTDFSFSLHLLFNAPILNALSSCHYIAFFFGFRTGFFLVRNVFCVCRCLCSVDTDVINGMNISAVFENDRPRKSPENKLHKTNIQITTLIWTTGFFSAQQHIFKCKYLSQLTFSARTKDDTSQDLAHFCTFHIFMFDCCCYMWANEFCM